MNSNSWVFCNSKNTRPSIILKRIKKHRGVGECFYLFKFFWKVISLEDNYDCVESTSWNNFLFENILK
jgi:hypothetical protein